MAGPCLLSDGQSFSSGGGNASGPSGGWNAVVTEHLHRTVQPAAPAIRALVQWPLQSLIVDGSGSGYLRTVCEYVHLDPVRAKLLTGEQRLREYRWSSFGEYLK